jgi:hypothetical protein
MASAAGNPYAAPGARVSDAAAGLGRGARSMRVLAFFGNAFLLLLPLVLFFSSRRPDVGYFIMTGYCVIVALASGMALAFRDRFSFWAALGANALGLLFAAALLAYLAAEGDSDWWAVFFIAVPAALNLLAVLMVRRSRGPSDDTVATRR